MAEIHAISFDWEGFHPHLRAFDARSGEILDFDFWNLDFKVSHYATCVGNWTGGRYSPCPTSERVRGGNICEDCASAFLPDPDCMFEPKCDGEDCGMKFCAREHAVYLAFHGHITKVGITASGRLKQRMIEQGADAYSVIARVKGRKTARTMEVAIADRLALRQRVRGIESLAMMTEPFSAKKTEETYTETAGKIEDFGHRPSTLKFLENYPIKLPLERMPRQVREGGHHKGKPVGVKGKYLVFENGGLNALSLQNMPGRHIRASAKSPSRPLECWR